MNHYEISVTEDEMEFFRQLFSSQLPVTINTVELVAELKRKLLTAKARPVQVRDARPEKEELS